MGKVGSQSSLYERNASRRMSRSQRSQRRPRELRVVLERIRIDDVAGISERNISPAPEVVVQLERISVESTSLSRVFLSPGDSRRSGVLTSEHLRRQRKLASQRRRLQSSSQSVSQPRLTVVLERIDDREAISETVVPLVVPAAVPVVGGGGGDGGGSSGDSSDDGEGAERQATPEMVPSPVPGVAPPVVREIVREVIPPRKLTYKLGVTVDRDQLEQMCGAIFTCGLFDQLCGRCGAKYFRKEPVNRNGIRLGCCKNGVVVVPPLGCPEQLRQLYTENTPRNRQFMENIRAANSVFAMASFKTSAPGREVQGRGRWCFTICGQIYHFTMGVPNTQDLREPVLSHYYFVDVDEVMDRRNAHLEDRVSAEVVRFLDECLRRHNRYIRAYRTMGEVLEEERDRRGGEPLDDIVIGFCRRGQINDRMRRYDLPESRSNIAAVFYGMEPPFSVDLALYPRDVDEDGERVLRRHELKNLNPMSDPLVFPLLFPLGEDGYSQGMRHGGHKITMREFYRYRIQSRDAFSLLHNGGKLFQQYLVDAWVRVEADLLWYIRQNQDKFRIAQQTAVRRMIAANPDALGRVGRALVLPSAFQGGERNMQRQYLDAMAVVARHGKPDLFITFTCNPRWPEIQNNLEYMQKSEHRPDLVCRVFRVKLLEFMDDIVHKQLYGIVKNYHYVIEFQKRGLPHAHIVVTFVRGNNLVTPDDVDGIVSAVIPDRVTQPRLYDLVSQFQVHRPCGRLNPGAVCMVDGHCKKYFPKEYRDATALNAAEDLRPLYKRPRDDRYIDLNGCVITNSRIVPYNPYALAKYQTHINFEVVGSVRSLRYLYKYVSKGPHSMTVVTTAAGGDGAAARDVRYQVDEVADYLDCRYVSSMEAAWRLFEFKMHDRSHSVMVLPVYLPGGFGVVFEYDDDIENIEDRLQRIGKLEAWFALNAQDAQARVFTYPEIPEHYTWDGRRGVWLPRRQVSKMIGCMAEVSLREDNVELFYLRLLLKHATGATSYEDLRTVDGNVVCETFRAACEARHLIENVDEYQRCLAEAAQMMFPGQLRRLFVLIVYVLADDRIGQVVDLWRRNKEEMIEDFLRNGMRRREAVAAAIEDVRSALARMRPELTCEALGIVLGDEDGDAGEAGENPPRRGGDIAEEVFQPAVYDPVLLNADQKRIFVRVVVAVARNMDRRLPVAFYDIFDDEVRLEEIDVANGSDDNAFYVDGPGGTGKTYLYNTIIHYLNNVLNVQTVAVAWTGIAANLLIGGKTVHRTFRLPINLDAGSTVGWTFECRESEKFENVYGLILWDEAPMTNRYAVEAVDRYFRQLKRRPSAIMGGKCVLFGGDYRQVLPVVGRGHRAAIIDATLKASVLWRDFVKLKLSSNMRAAATGAGEVRYPEFGGKSYGEWLLSVGEGKVPYVTFETFRHLPVDLIEIPAMFDSPSLERLISFVYGDDFAEERVGDKAVLCPTNAAVDEVNNVILERLQGEFRSYFSVDSMKSDPGDTFRVSMDVLNSVNVSGLPPHELKLKVGAVVLLIRNLDLDRGECNGTRMIVTHLAEHFVECRILCGERRGQAVWLPRIKMVARHTMLPKEIVRFQFPLRVAYAMTINKAQGQTLRRIGVYLKNPCFAHGQLYVAFSRVGRPEDVRVYVEQGLGQGALMVRHNKGKKFTRNVVYHSVLDDTVDYGRDLPMLRQFVPRRDIAERGDLQEIFGPDQDDTFYENLDVSQIERERQAANASRPLVEVVDDDQGERNFVPYHIMDNRGLFGPPQMTRSQLAARVSVGEVPGTTGSRVVFSPPRYFDSDSD